MSIIYTVIARRTTVLARFASCIGNFADVTELLLGKIDVDSQRRTRMSLTTDDSDGFLYHYITEADLIYLCIAEKADSSGVDSESERAIAFQYLDTVKDRFEAAYGSNVAPNVIPFAMNADFSSVLAAETKRSNGLLSAARRAREERASDDKIERLQGEVEQVKNIMSANINSIVERGERLDLLVDKTENLSNESVSFRQSSRRLQRKMWWQNTKMKVALGAAILIVVYVCISAACGGAAWPKCV